MWFRSWDAVLYPLPMIHTVKRLLDLVIPVAQSHDNPLAKANQVQRNTLSDPQARQPPTVECQMNSKWKSKAIVAQKVYGRSNMLAAHSSQRTSAAAVEAVSDLE